MPYIMEYLLKFSISLGVLYIFYQLVLRPLTFYQWNRFYLLCYSLLSFFIPFVNISSWLDSYFQDSHLLKSIPVFKNLTSQIGVTVINNSQPSVISMWNIGLLIISIGVGFMLVRLITQYLSLQKLRRHAVLVYENDILLYDVQSEIGPFSFGKSIFVNRRLHTEEELQKIIRHEFVHVKQKHSIDMLVGEIICMINWFNPFAWLIRKAIRQNLEFIADHKVLQTGLDARQYQYLLLKVIGFPQYSITSNFNFSSLKKRIAMMNKMKTARVHLVKFLFVLPVLSVMLLAFREKMNSKKDSLVNEDASFQNKAIVNASVTTVADTIPLLPPPPPLPEGVKRISIDDKEAVVTLKDGIKETYNLLKPEERAAFEAKYGKIHPPHPPKAPQAPELPELLEVRPVPAVPAVPPVPAMPKNVKSIKMDSKITVTLKDGTKESYDLSKPAEKANFEKKYGNLEPPSTPVPPVPAEEPVEAIVPVNAFINGKPVRASVKVRAVNNVNVSTPTLIIVDGEPLPDGSNINSIPGSSIKSVQVIKNAQAASVYGKKATNGVVIITTNKNENARSNINNSQNIDIKPAELNLGRYTDFTGLLIINGKESPSEALSKIDPSSIKEINVLKGDSATSLYKVKGSKGVIIITTK